MKNERSNLMNEADPYPHPPIIEALFDIQVELPKKVTVTDLERLSFDISDQYPIKHTRKRFEGKFELIGNRSATESIDFGIDGFINWSSDKKQVVQFRLDGFTFSRLKPYAGWNSHFPEVIRNWNLYAEKLSPMRVKRVTVRFINTIEIPSGKLALNDYFVNFPQTPLKNSILNNFFNRVELSVTDYDAEAVITQTLAQSNNPTTIPVIFDLEVFKAISYQPDTKTLSEVFEALRDIKNDIFKNCLTPKTKDLFK